MSTTLNEEADFTDFDLKKQSEKKLIFISNANYSDLTPKSSEIRRIDVFFRRNMLT